jgi:hypothetical protein
MLVAYVVISPTGAGHSVVPPHVGHTTRTGSAAAPTPRSVNVSTLDQSVPDSPPPGVTWQIVDTLAIPFSTTAGPASVVGGIPSGFAHTPTGALIAMAQIVSRISVQPNFMAVTETDVANTAGKATFSQLVAAGGVGNPPDPSPGTYAQLAGFQFVSYTPTTAVIQLLSGLPDSSYEVSTLTVAWDGTDWQLVFGPAGTVSPNQQVVSSPVGFVIWGGV